MDKVSWLVGNSRPAPCTVAEVDIQQDDPKVVVERRSSTNQLLSTVPSSSWGGRGKASIGGRVALLVLYGYRIPSSGRY